MMENIDNPKKMEEETIKNEQSSNKETGSHVQGVVNDSFHAINEKYRAAWNEIKQYPNTCRYFEPTQSQLRLIVASKYTARDAFEAAGDHDQPCRSCMANQRREDCFFSTVLQDLPQMPTRKRMNILRWHMLLYASICMIYSSRKSTATYAH